MDEDLDIIIDFLNDKNLKEYTLGGEGGSEPSVGESPAPL